MAEIKNRLILVSNRLPVTCEKLKKGGFKLNNSSGGLVAGLREIHQSDDVLWIGHAGIVSSDEEYELLKNQLKKDRLIPVNIQKKDYESYYNGACNNVIWPLFHYFPNAIKPDIDDWLAYQAVNLKFAKHILKIAGPNDRIWVHDYQLMLLPALLRKENPELSIAYFHHIPFPSSELLRILSSRSELLEGLLGADLIGFHTYEYVSHFLTSVMRILGNHTHLDEIMHEGRRVKVVANPLGVDVQMIQKDAENTHLNKEILQLSHQIGDRTVLLGIDRLDYTKGIPERLMAFREFLLLYPEYIGKVTLIQISVPSRANMQSYAKLRRSVERIIGKINGEFGSPGYTPVQYFYRGFTQSEIINFYKIADIAVVTPLRDGLNLVAKEYVAAKNDNEGVLILSEMAGAAAEMGEALLVNPYDRNAFALSIHKALTMSMTERTRRMTELRKRIIEYNNMNWMKTFIASWEEVEQRNHRHSKPLRVDKQSQLISAIVYSRRYLIFLGYDNTLIPTSNRHEEMIPTESCRQILKDLCQKKNVELTLITDKTQNFCNVAFNGLPINLVAENGALIQLNKHTNTWQPFFNLEEFHSIEKEVLPLLENFTHHLPGAYIERKQFSIVWNFRQADPIFARAQARQLSTLLSQLLENTPFNVFSTTHKLEIRHILANKGYALEKIICELDINSQDSLITLGNDDSDEEMYKISPEQNIGIHIGSSSLFAKYHLRSTHETQKLLQGFITHL